VIADRGWTGTCPRPFVTWMPGLDAAVQADFVEPETEDS
jgi:hypothetical protein